MALTPEERIRWQAYTKKAYEKSKQNPKPCVNNDNCGNNAAPRRTLCYSCKAVKWKCDNPDAAKSYDQDKRARLKKSVTELYGGRCVCCGESELVFLTFDHVVPIGNKNRVVQGTKQLYDARKRYGDGYYQVLCFNCNFAKHWGGCPHQKARH